MKTLLKITAILIIIVMTCTLLLPGSSAIAKKKSKSAGLSEEQITQMVGTIDKLTKKVYALGLFSPQDNENLINIKMQLDDSMLLSPDVQLAPLYYKAATLYKMRDYNDEAIECYKTILENFPDTALAPKATEQLKKMGVTVAPSIPKE